MDELQEIKRKLSDLEQKLNNINTPANVSEDFLNTLVSKGFVRYVGPQVLTYTNPSGRDFFASFFKFDDNRFLLETDFFTSSTGTRKRRFLEFTADVSDTLTCYNHGLSDTQQVRIYTTGNIPAGLSPQTIYYVINSTADTLKLSLSSGGAAVNVTSTGGPFNYLVAQ